MPIKLGSPDEFRALVHDEVKFYLRAYLDILDAQKEEKPGWEQIFYHSNLGIADSLGLSKREFVGEVPASQGIRKQPQFFGDGGEIGT
jgi:hypothetical protein